VWVLLINIVLVGGSITKNKYASKLLGTYRMDSFQVDVNISFDTHETNCSKDYHKTAALLLKTL
jgi:hypothetical protein